MSTKFDQLDLHPHILKAIELLPYEHCTDVQAAAIPAVFDGKDILVNAETGSGKTAAFLLPVLTQLLNDNAPGSETRALIMLPTRELATQTMKNFLVFSKFSHVKAGLITGGEDFKFQQAIFRKNPEIIIATPGRIVDHINRGSCDFSDLEFLILDEADRMLDMGFSEDVLRVAEASNEARQTLCFSATLHQRGLRHMVKQVMREPVTIDVAPEQEHQAQIQQQMILVDDQAHKEKLCAHLLKQETFERAIVFCNTKNLVESLGGTMIHQGHNVLILHGDKSHEARKKVIQKFRQSKQCVLIATDVAARGLDIPDLELVINFDLAHSGDEYTHRIGRTGRAGKTGLAISFVAQRDWNVMAGIQRYLGAEFERRKVDSLLAKFKGPKKVKSSGKAVGNKKKKGVTKGSEKDAIKRGLKKANPKKTRPVKKGPRDGFGVLKKKPGAGLAPD